MDELELRISTALRQADAATGDEDFSAGVMAALPRRRFAGARARRWTLAMAAAAGALFTAVFGAPLERIVSALVPGGEPAALVVAVLAGALVAVPMLWSLWSAHD